MKVKLSKRARSILPITIVVILVGGAVVFLIHRHSAQSTHKVTFVQTEPSTSPSSTKNPSNNTSSPQAGSTDKTSSNTSTPATGTAPQPPVDSGFVSSHTVSLSANQTEESTCTVQPGVSCDIILTKGSVTKDLGVQTAGSNGYVIWDWKPADIGLSDGSWSISASATVNGKSSNTTDAKPLEVQP